MKSFTTQQSCSPRSDPESPNGARIPCPAWPVATQQEGAGAAASASERRANRRPQKESAVFFSSLSLDPRATTAPPYPLRPQDKESGDGKTRGRRVGARPDSGGGGEEDKGAAGRSREAKGRSRGVTWTAGREAE